MSAPSLQLFPVPLPSLMPTTLRDVSIAGGRYQGQQGLSPEQLSSLRGEAARLRWGYRSAALRSTLLEWRSNVDVSRPPGDVDVVWQDVSGELEPLLPPRHPSPPQPDPRDCSGDAPVAALGPRVSERHRGS